MPKPTPRPRCECCDEVMDELLTMRQGFEKMFHRLTNQIIELRRELNSKFIDKSKQDQNTDSFSFYKGEEASSSTFSQVDLPASKKQRVEKVEDTNWEEPINFDFLDTLETPPQQASDPAVGRAGKAEQKTAYPQLVIESVEGDFNDDSSSKDSSSKRSALEFYSIKGRVMPTQPFNKTEDFETFEELLRNDEDQRDQLRLELLQGHYDGAERYIKSMWNKLLSDDVANLYSYRGASGRKKTKAIKNYTFTSILKECFLQRFEQLDAHYFIERTMRYFSNSHDRLRYKKRRNRFEALNDTDSQTMDE